MTKRNYGVEGRPTIIGNSSARPAYSFLVFEDLLVLAIAALVLALVVAGLFIAYAFLFVK
jgi:hypothetical protein